MTKWASWARATRLCLLVLVIGCSSNELEAGGLGAAAEMQSGDPVRGGALYMKYECFRCHTTLTLDRPRRATEKTCTACHKAIEFAARDPSLIRLIPGMEADGRSVKQWDETIVHFRHTPTVISAAKLMRRDWLVRYLREPHQIPVKIRPRLGESMPRLDIPEQDARDLVSFLSAAQTYSPLLSDEAIADFRRDVAPFGRGSPTRGAAVFAAQECGQCHNSDNARSPISADRRHTAAIARAPDLRITRDRFRPEMLVPWLLDPRYHKNDAAMPKFNLTYRQARDLAAFIMDAPLEPPKQRTLPPRLPILRRAVGFEEVNRQVFRRVCRHCHASPEYAIGDGGPGMTGGFGFKARQLNLAEYSEVHAGYVDDDGERRSLFDKLPDGTPILVAALLSRQLEEIGKSGPLRGMPLALPSLSPKEIQLVETWIAQGHRRVASVDD